MVKGEMMGIQAISGSSSISMTRLAEAQASTATNKATAQAAKKTGGTPPAGGSGAAKPAESSASTSSASSASSTSSTSLAYDPRDTNQDGIVSMQEELAYTINHPTEETQESSEVSESQKQVGLYAYRQDQQANSQMSLASKILSA
jgi:hypothetical protein